MSEKAALGKASSDTASRDNNVCEWCDKSLATASGLRRHKRLVHEDKLDNPCPTCDKQFTSERGVKIHHKRSHDESLSYVTETCIYCGDDFEYKWHRRPNAKYCNENCRDKHQVQENHPHWKGGKVELECDWCGGSFEVDPHKSDTRRFCNEKCGGRWWGCQITGKDNPSWAGGKVRYYGPNWPEQRRKARERDNYTCQVCGKHEHDKNHSVHHVIPLRRFKDNYDWPEWWKRGNGLVNLVTMCEPCHNEWEGLYLRPDPRGEQ